MKRKAVFTGTLLIMMSVLLTVGCFAISEPTTSTTTSTASTMPTTSTTATSEPTTTISPTSTSTQTTTQMEQPVHSSGYIKFEGIDGEATSEGHEKWSEIVAFSQSMHQPNDGSIDSSRRRGDVVFEDIVVVRAIDKASPKLAEACVKGKVFSKVEIHLTGPSEGSTCDGTFYAYELTNVLITGYKVTGSNPLAFALVAPAPDITMPYSGPFIVQAVDAPMEEVALNFEEIKVTYTECDSDGLMKGNVEYSWKVEEGES